MINVAGTINLDWGTQEIEELDETDGDNFDQIYKGEVSKSGTAILPSKRTRRTPEKFNVAVKKSEEDKETELKENNETSPAGNKTE